MNLEELQALRKGDCIEFWEPRIGGKLLPSAECTKTVKVVSVKLRGLLAQVPPTLGMLRVDYFCPIEKRRRIQCISVGDEGFKMCNRSPLRGRNELVQAQQAGGGKHG